MALEIPQGAAYYIEKRTDTNLVFKRDSRGIWVEVQKFPALADARDWVKADSKDNYLFYDDRGDRIAWTSTNPQP